MNNRLLFVLLVCCCFCSCTKWDDYTTDYDYSAVYFAYQNQLRTLVAKDQMSFDFGVYLSGRRENTKDEWAKYRIEPELLDDKEYVGDKMFKLLPEDCYSLSSPGVFNIRKGSFLGTSKIIFDIDKFTSLPNATDVTYALPVRVYETSVDSILVGKFSEEGSIIIAPKDYAIIAVKYINPYHGNYYVKGTRYKLVGGEYVVDEVYSRDDLSKNKVIQVSTLDLHNSVTTVAGGISSTELMSVGLKINVETDGAVILDKADHASGILSFKDINSKYDTSERRFRLNYEYSTSVGIYKVEEDLIWRDTEMKFEQW